MSLRVRPASAADVAALQRMIPESARGLSRGFYTDEQVESAIRHVFGVDSQLIADGTYLLAEDAAGTLAGCGGWSRRQTLFGGDCFKGARPDPLLDPQRDAARIRAFFVHPDCGRRGVGRALLDACEAAARAAGFSRLELGATLPGVPFYAALGFVAQAPLSLTFPDGVVLPLVQMTKALSAS